MKRKKVTYRPSKTEGLVGGIGGLLFVLIGVVLVIPTFGLFGVFWTGIALAITISSFYRSFGEHYDGPEIYIEEDEPHSSVSSAPPQQTAEARLTFLQSLYEQGLITSEEYEQKRKDILAEL